MLEETPDVITRGFVLDARTEALLKEIPGLVGAAIERRAWRTDRSRPDQGEDSSGPPAVFPQAFGPPAVRAAGRDGDLMASSALSRRMSEFLGVALFATALIWLISLASYSAVRSRVVLQHRLGSAADEFRRPHRRVHRRAVVPDARLLRLPDPAGPGGHRLALLLVPDDGRRLHEAARAPRCSSAASRRSCRWRSARSTSAARSSAPAATSATASRPSSRST